MKIVDKSAELQKRVENWVHGFGKGKYSRILKMARKPTAEEYGKVLAITSAGIIIIGGLGFLIYYILSVWLNINHVVP
ncbi:MAG: protein translocase SEC61 complex subunit gamma [Thermoplasmata archaeon]|nr:protein translocase SEC61 complex subunit gamma [Thermoplasmata archaeon]